jgi:hypothetical protein
LVVFCFASAQFFQFCHWLNKYIAVEFDGIIDFDIITAIL